MGEGQKSDSAVPGSSRSRLGDRCKGDWRTTQAKGCWKLPLKDDHSLTLENESAQCSQHGSLHFSGYKGSQGFLLVMLAVTDLATWRSAGPTAGPLFSCSRAQLCISVGDRLHQLFPDWQEIELSPSSQPMAWPGLSRKGSLEACKMGQPGEVSLGEPCQEGHSHARGRP